MDFVEKKVAMEKIFLRALPLSVPFHENPIYFYTYINDIL